MNSDPLIRLGVPIKQVLTISGERPMISYNCAPRYEAILEMPIFDRIFNNPLFMP